MNCYRGCREGIEPSLLFFFLILVMIFCKPGIIGYGDERRGPEAMSEPSCGC